MSSWSSVPIQQMHIQCLRQRLKQALRKGAKLIVVDPRQIALVKSPHVKAEHHLQLLPGTNVAIINALAHVVMTEGLADEKFIAERCDTEAFKTLGRIYQATRKLS
jgi:predicted molibdopterin-dependent oxidoreductase YjgC